MHNEPKTYVRLVRPIPQKHDKPQAGHPLTPANPEPHEPTANLNPENLNPQPLNVKP